MRLLVLDTETINVIKPLVYNLGYVIYDTDTNKIIKTKDYLIKQVYDNLELFNTAYFANKRPLYEQKVADGLVTKVYWGNAIEWLKKDIERYKIDLFAYNSKFDKRAITFTNNFFGKTDLPNDIADIMKIIKPLTDSQHYKDFCRINGFITKNGRTMRKTETLYKYLINDINYQEEHMALADSLIELDILLVGLGLKLVV